MTSAPTLNEAISKLLEEGQRVDRWRGSTIRNYNRAQDWLERHPDAYGALRISDIDAGKLRRAVWLDAHEHRQRARQVRTVLLQTFAWAVSQGRVPRNPFASDPIEFPKQKNRSRPRALTAQERKLLDELLDRYEQRDKPGPKPAADARDIIEVSLATGYRISEALGILAEDVTENPDGSVTLSLTGSVVERNEHGASSGPRRVGTTKMTEASDEPVRQLLLGGRAAQILRRRARTAGTGLLFSTRNGTPYQQGN